DVAEIGSAFSGTTITTASAAITVSSVDSYANVVLSGGSFGARFASNFYGDFTQSGGTLTGVANFFGDFTWTGGTQGVGVTYVHSSMFISGLPVVASREIDASYGGEIFWTSGTIFASPGHADLQIKGPLTLSGSSDKHLNGVTLFQSGPTTWTGSGAL